MFGLHGSIGMDTGGYHGSKSENKAVEHKLSKTR